MRIRHALLTVLALVLSSTVTAAGPQAGSEDDRLARILSGEQAAAAAPTPQAESLPAKRVRKAQRSAVGESKPKPAFQPYQEEAQVESRRGKIVPGLLLVKFAPDDEGGAEALTKVSTTPGVASAKRVFPHAVKDDPFAKGVRRTRAANAPTQNQEEPLPDLTRWQRVYVTNQNADVQAAAAAMKQIDGVEWAEPIYERRTNGIPDATTDPLYANQWHLDDANVPAAWAYLEEEGKLPGGSSDITVAVIDTGVDYTHSDLAGNMWVNIAEVAGNGIDDDGNGFIDDVHGVTVVGSSYDHSGEPQDDNGHGTHVAGIIAAAGENSIGGTGIAYGVKIMAIKAAQYSGILTTADIAEGIYYAAAQGADVINMSFGGYGRSQVEEDALAVAFGTSVLVAAAGNDGRPNEGACLGSPMYPASYPWVLGVMAKQQTPDAQGDYLAGFSNWDCKPKNGLEYELMAPGSQVWSTLPGEGHAGWSGTSMAAPVVSGIAALLRTNWSDKSVYSSRFIMGQVAGTGPVERASTPLVGLPFSYHKADAFEALINTPRPSLSYLEHWVWDTTAQAASNDDDGIVDAGETIDLAIVVKNHWGKGDPVSVTLTAIADGAVNPDPYVTMITDTVDYGAVGSFNQDDNGLIYDVDGIVTGVNSPFQFSVAPNTPNDHLIPFLLTMTAGNGLDQSDPQTYTTTSRFYLIVQRGRQLPSVIDSDAIGTDGGNVDTDGVVDGIVTLDDSSLWIIDKPVLVYPGIELKMTEGAQVQFWSTQPDDPYSGPVDSFLQVEGTWVVQGTASRPVIMGPSALFPTRGVKIRTHHLTGTVDWEYAVITNLEQGDENGVGGGNFSSISHSLFQQNPGWLPGGSMTVLAADIQKSRFYKMGQHDLVSFGFESPTFESLFDNSKLYYCPPDGVNGVVFLKNSQRFANLGGAILGSSLYGGSLGQALGAEIFEASEFNGSTYAAFHPYLGGTTSLEKMHMAQSFAESLDGHVVVFSDQAEMDFVGNWLYGQSQQPFGYWGLNYSFCNVPDPNDTYCASIFDNAAAIGLVRTSGQDYAWINGESPAIGFPEDQYQWDNSSVSTWLRQADFAGIYSLSENYAQSQNFLAPGIGYSDGAGSYDHNIILELPGSHTQQSLEAALSAFSGAYLPQDGFTNNAILNVWHDLNADHWLKITAPNGDPTRRWSTEVRIPNNYWGGAGDSLISIAITDYSDDFNLMPMSFQPVLEVAPESAYPFVVDVVFTDENGLEVQGNRFGAEEINWTVTFNRDMDTSVQPNVNFGPTEPFTDFAIPGDWVNPRTWQGSFTLTPVTGDGWQYAYIQGAVAANDPWLVTGHDSERFRFEIITSGTEALTLQATGGVDKVDLSWIQDDFELLHGYNVYRSLDADGSFTRINGVVIPVGTNTYSDTNVAPGIDHYYRFKVVTDRGESDFSNTALGKPTDSIPPVLSHTPIAETIAGSNRTLTATITDNISVQSATLYYRPVGETTYLTRVMVNTPVDQYSATLEGSLLEPPGVDYYLSATDGTNTITFASALSPQRLAVGDMDRDGMPDDWENTFGLNANDPADASGDSDNDGLINGAEYQAGTDPTDADSDGDGVSDLSDVFALDPAESVDTDGDGIGNNADLDDDNDGMTDEFESANNLAPLDPTDAETDADGDGFTNLREFTAGSNPQDAADFPTTRKVPVAIQILLSEDED